ncbi:Threonine dehydratase biosynthetic (EC [uncultured Gammaproteobacteria bacterium]|nr:Threonine dehydratase biosynthetic (EC [uncultured Gammaproteobacteria bacterium]
MLIDKLSQSFDVLDMSNNSIAKTHIRYMVGGRADAGNEVLYRFEFPERPGALLDFLKKSAVIGIFPCFITVIMAPILGGY